ncbi:hypothetical protein J601_1074 [Acinetobacter baumannii 831240]|nr:hypothetical protein J505_3604 [Acinetobacter baumannii 1297549]EXF22662.1 hypothetical protein J601_1074 [Acinetobacter baumannii 831240]EXH51120.1 hypothetical protein J605_0007 [Acinetobacter baumannii 1412924]
MLLKYGLRQPTGNVGQHAKDNSHSIYRQAQKVTTVLK